MRAAGPSTNMIMIPAANEKIFFPAETHPGLQSLAKYRNFNYHSDNELHLELEEEND
jgi:hypothetical protein